MLPPDAFLPLRKSEYVNRGFKPTEEVEDLSKVNLERDSETVNKEISSFELCFFDRVDPKKAMVETQRAKKMKKQAMMDCMQGNDSDGE